jgi:hypothetical protein
MELLHVDRQADRRGEATNCRRTFASFIFKLMKTQKV